VDVLTEAKQEINPKLQDMARSSGRGGGNRWYGGGGGYGGRSRGGYGGGGRSYGRKY